MKSTTLVLVCLFAHGLFGQQVSTSTTAEMLNGRAWKNMSNAEHVYYLASFRDGLIFRILYKELSMEIFQSKWAEHFTVGDYVNELDKVYQASENINIPAPLVIAFSTKKLQGTLTKDQIETELQEMRSLTHAILDN
jgi:hypothetical protein